MKIEQREPEIRVDKFDLVQQILHARSIEEISFDELDDIVSLYEKNVALNIKKRKFSQTMCITSSQKQLLKKICQ